MNHYDIARNIQTKIWYGEITTSEQLHVVLEGSSLTLDEQQVVFDHLTDWHMDVDNPGNSQKIRSAKGNWFDCGTDSDVIRVLESFFGSNERVKITFGDKATGALWEVFGTRDTTGRVGRSTGSKPELLLVNNSRSTGGSAISTSNILQIEYANTKTHPNAFIYKHLHS